MSVLTTPVAANFIVNMTATGGGKTVTGTLNVEAPSLSKVSLSPSSLRGGMVNSMGAVTISSLAPTAGLAFTLASSNTSAATTVNSANVPSGATTATFPITTYIVPSNTSSTIKATGHGTSKTAMLSVAH